MMMAMQPDPRMIQTQEDGGPQAPPSGRTTARRDARIVHLQACLFDHTGHVWKGLSNDEVRLLVQEINGMRVENRWVPLDMAGRMRPRKYPRPAEMNGWEYR